MFKRASTALLMLMFISGCSANMSVNDWCKRDHVITVSADDIITTRTEREILTHNEMGKAECSW